MEMALKNLSKEDLLKVISIRDPKIDYLESQLAMYKRMQFGQKRERFEGDPNQTMLPLPIFTLFEDFKHKKTPLKLIKGGN